MIIDEKHERDYSSLVSKELSGAFKSDSSFSCSVLLNVKSKHVRLMFETDNINQEICLTCKSVENLIALLQRAVNLTDEEYRKQDNNVKLCLEQTDASPA